MGRWGHRVLEADEDIKHVTEIAKDISSDKDDQLAWILSKALTTAPQAIRDFYKLEYNLDLGNSCTSATIREKLDAGLGAELLQKYRSVENVKVDMFPSYGMYHLVILAAVMMGVGAKLSDDHIQHLKEIVPAIPFREGIAIAWSDEGFRGPGQRQFKMALDKYTAGVPRDFAEPSCHACGKIAADNEGGKPLNKCHRCTHPTAAAFWCNKKCRKSLWTVHKDGGNCGAPRGQGVAIFQGHGKTGTSISMYQGAMV